MLPEMKHIILTNMNVKLYSWPLMFHKAVRQIWVIVLIPASSTDPFWIQEWKIWKLTHCCRS